MDPKPKKDLKKEPKTRGRPKRGTEKCEKELSRIERQRTMTLEEMLDDLPKACDKGAKKDSKGNVLYWIGYKLHLDTVDGDIPVSAILTSASVHDSQAAIPLATITKEHILFNCYDLMDIGIIMCKEKNRTIVEYALKDATKPINVASYHVVSKLSKELKNELPSPEQIAKLLEFIE